MRPDSLEREIEASVAMIDTAMIGMLMNLKRRMKIELTKSANAWIVSPPQRPLQTPSTIATR
jgi:hypothetical protein